MDSVSARFDDVAAGTALVFGVPDRVVSAYSLDEVRDVLSEVDQASQAGAWGWGYVTYEAAPAFDSALRVHSRQADSTPLVRFALGAEPSREVAIAPIGRNEATASSETTKWTADWNASSFEQRVEAVRTAIEAGVVYQVNLTTRFRCRNIHDLLHFYSELAAAQGGAYNAYLDIGSAPTLPADTGVDPCSGPVVISASPELFFRWDDTGITARPMKGTAPRGVTDAEDERVRAGLLTSEKERAENVMIVDLLRNDLSRLAQPGSVQVKALLQAEQYPTVWQLTSTIVAQPHESTTLLDVFDALFPCGSVTGAPKVAAMNVIAGLEDSPRGVYCGAVGVVAPPGSTFRARFSVPIRTVAVHRLERAAVFGSGGGITWSSEPAGEWDEVMTKATILDRPLTAGVALLETMRFTPEHGLRNLDRHLDRLVSSAGHFGITAARQRIHHELELVAGAFEQNGARRVRLMLARSGRVVIEDAALTVVDGNQVLDVVLDNHVTVPDVWTRHKTTRRDVYEAAAARHPSAADVLLVDVNGYLLEATRANVAVRLGRQWCTPPLASGCLPGVERQRLIDEGVLVERPIHTSDLTHESELALISSLRGWRPARVVGERARR
ncbi:chorismate-binding protein [Jatrophihabitans sp. YIM 134969]